MTGGLSSTSSTSVVIESVIDTKLEEVRFFFFHRSCASSVVSVSLLISPENQLPQPCYDVLETREM